MSDYPYGTAVYISKIIQTSSQYVSQILLGHKKLSQQNRMKISRHYKFPVVAMDRMSTQEILDYIMDKVNNDGGIPHGKIKTRHPNSKSL